MDSTISEAELILQGINDRLPYKINEVTGPDEQQVLATIRGNDGYPVLLPHPESMSILTGDRSIFNFIERGPVVIQGLLDIIAQNGAESGKSGEKARNSA